MPFTTQCPHCSARFKVADGHIGRKASCKRCHGEFVITEVPPVPPASGSSTIGSQSTSTAQPYRSAPPRASADSEQGNIVDFALLARTEEAGHAIEELRECPSCAEKISIRATKCRYCGEKIDAYQSGSLSHGPTAQRTSIGELGSRSHLGKASQDADETLGFWILCLPLAALVPWLIRVLLRELDPALLVALGSLEVLAFIAAGVLVFIEAKRLGMGSEVNRVWGVRPGFWLFGYIILWPIFYPLYLYKRSAYGVRNWGLPGLAVVSVFLIIGVVRFTYHTRSESGGPPIAEPSPAAELGGGRHSLSRFDARTAASSDGTTSVTPHQRNRPAPAPPSAPPLDQPGNLADLLRTPKDKLSKEGQVIRSRDAVRDDLLDYVNVHVRTLARLEADAIERFNNEIGDNYKNDERTHAAIAESLPKYKTFIGQLEQVYPKGKEVRSIHETWIKAANLQLSGMALMASAIEEQDATLVTSSNEKMAEGRRVMREFQNELASLLKEYGIGPKAPK
jgi:predicted Zn finger-like uncharacterized protein